jgi:serine protease Do
MEQGKMGFRRVVGLAAVFGVGVAVGGLLLRGVSNRSGSDTQARQRALRILDQRPVAIGIGDNRIVQAVQRIEPAVVNIDTVGRMRAEDENGLPFFIGREVRGKGSGVILTADGYIVTNNHVIDGANRIRVTLPDGNWYFARLIGRDPSTDLAVVRVDATHLPAAEMGDSDRLQVGEWSIAVGNPLGLGSTVTVGVVSALNRHNLQVDEGHTLDGAIQTDAAINRGNSGGALANINGQLVGINTAILSSGPSGGSIGLGFAIPVNTVRRVVRDLIANETAKPAGPRTPWIGITYNALPPDVSQALGLPSDRGVQIDHVQPESPASLAGLKDEDILLAINGREIHDVSDVQDEVWKHRVGEKAILHILRPDERREHDIAVILQESPDNLQP